MMLQYNLFFGKIIIKTLLENRLKIDHFADNHFATKTPRHEETR